MCVVVPGGFEHAGGIGRWAGYLFDAWPKQGPHGPPTDEPELVLLDTRGHGGIALGIVAFLRSLLQLGRLWIDGRLGLLHLNLSVRGSTVRKTVISTLAYLAGVPTIVHLHSGRYPQFYAGLPRWARAAVRRMFRRATCVVVLGRCWEDFLVTELGVPRTKIRVVPNAVPLPRCAPSPRQSVDATCHILMLGRLSKPKGVPDLITALASDPLRDLPWRMTFAGDGDVALYRRMTEQLGIAAKVDFAGWLGSAAVTDLLTKADVLVLPSHSENMPVAVIEALSYGIPVVTTPVGTTPEILTDEQSALLVPVGDPGALAHALVRLVRDRALRARIGQAGLSVFMARLNMDQSAEVYADLYRSLLPAE